MRYVSNVEQRQKRSKGKSNGKTVFMHIQPALRIVCMVGIRVLGYSNWIRLLFFLFFSSFFICIFLALQHSICSNSKWNERLPHLFAWYIFHMLTYTCFINFVISKHFRYGNGLPYRFENLFPCNFMEIFIQCGSGYSVVTVPYS